MERVCRVGLGRGLSQGGHRQENDRRDLTMTLILKRGHSRSSGEGNDDDFDVLADGVVVGRISKAEGGRGGRQWMWTMLFDSGWPTQGYAASREAGMAASAKSWWRE